MGRVLSPHRLHTHLVALVLGLLPVALQAQSDPVPLTDLAGWTVPGLEAVQVAGAVVEADGTFAGTLPALGFAGAATPEIVGIPVGDGRMALVVALPSFTVGNYLPALAGTSLNEIRFDGARLLLTPDGAQGTEVTPPVGFGPPLALPTDSGLDAGVELTGNLGSWFGDLSLPTSSLPLAGTLPVGLFTGSIPADQLAAALYPYLDLTVTVPPEQLAALPLTLPGATLTSIALRVDGSGGPPAYTLNGALSLGTVTLAVTAAPPAAGEAPTLTVTGDLTLADLVGVDAPGFSSLAVSGVTVQGATTSADLQLGTLPLQVVAFPTGSGGGNAVALTTDQLRLSDLMTTVAETLFDDLVLTAPTLVYAPTSTSSTPLPPSLAARLGVTHLDLTQGLGLSSAAALTGDVGQLLTTIGVTPTGLPLSAVLDPLVLSNPATTPDLRLAFPLGTLAPPGLTLTSTELVLALQAGVASAEVTAGLALSAGGLSLTLPEVRVRLDGDGNTEVAGVLPVAQLGDLVPVPGVTPVSAEVTATLGETGSAVALDGVVRVAGRDLTVRLRADTGSGSRSVSLLGELAVGELSGLTVPGLSDLGLSHVTVEVTPASSYTSAALNFGDTATQLVMFKDADQPANNLALLAPTLTLGGIAPVLADTPLDAVELHAPVLLIAPVDNGEQRAVATPAPVAEQRGESLGGTMDLSPGLRLEAAAVLSPGLVADLLTSVGAPTSGLPLDGRLDLGLLGNPLTPPDLLLEIPLGDLTPGGLTLNDTRLVLALESGVARVALATDLHLTLGTVAIDLPGVQASRDSGGNTVLSGPLPVSTLAALVPLPGLTPLSANLSVALGGGGTAVSLDGLVQVAGKELGVRLTADTGAGSRSVSLLGALTVGELSGLTVPGVSDLALSNLTVEVTPTSSYTAGGVTFGGVATTLVMFKESGQPANNLALLAPNLTLGGLIPTALGTPLDAVALDAPVLLIAPAANGEQTGVSTPAPVAQQRGESSGGTMNLSPGIRLNATAGLTGAAQALLASIGAPTGGLPLDGTFALDALAAGRPTLPNFDLTIPLPNLAPPGVPSNLLAFGASTLRLRAQDGDPSVGVETSASVAIAGRTLNFTTAITRGTEGGVGFTDIRGTSASGWASPFGVDWVDLEDLTLAAHIGATKSLSLGARTDLGSIHNLNVEIAIAFDAGGFQEASLALTGANIPLSAIPELGTLPGADQLTLRDIVVSNTAIAGKARLADGPWLNSVLFKSQKPSPGWNLAFLYEDVGLSDLIPGLPPGDPVLSKIRLQTAALVLSQKGATDDVGDLPTAAQGPLLTIFGSADRPLRLANGVSLLAGFDPSDEPAIADLLTQAGIAPDPMILSGAIGGLFGGVPSLDIAANLPPATLPPALSEFLLLKSVQTAFYVRLETLGPSLGVGVTANTDMIVGIDPNYQLLKQELDAVIEFELNATGGVSVNFYGETTEPWANPFSIPGIVLDPGCRLGFSVSATSEILLDLTAQTHIGDREVDLTGTVGFAGGPYPVKAALIGQVSEMSLADVMALSNAMVSATGKTPPQTDFPTVKLTDTGIGLASPLASVRLNDVELLGPGAYLEGDLWLIYEDQPLGEFKGLIDLFGLSAVGEIRDFDLGGFAMHGNNLDVYARVDPFNPPHFKVRGNATIVATEATVDMSVSSTGFSFFTEVGAQDFGFDFLAYFDGPATLTPAELAQVDMGLDCGLDVTAIDEFLSGPGAAAVGDALGELGDALEQAQADLATAQAAVSSLDAQIDAARVQVEAERGTIEEQLAAARAAVAAAAEVEHLEDQIDSYQSKIKTCNQTKKICVLRNPFTGKCVKTATVADLTKRAQCTLSNANYYGLIAARTTALQVARGALTAANTSLAILVAGIEQLPVDLDPRVAVLIVQRETALVAVAIAQETVNAMSVATAASQSGLALFEAGSNAFHVAGGRFSGSLQELIAERPVVLDLNYSVLGESYVTRLPFNPSDLIYTYNNLELLALQIVYGASLIDPNAPQSYKDFIYDAYLQKKGEVEEELTLVSAANAVQELEGNDDLLADQGPAVVPPADVEVEATGPLTTVAIGTATATDLVDGFVPVDSDAPDSYPIGLTVVTWTAEDASGHPGMATQRIVIVDTTPPTLDAPADVTGIEATAALTSLPTGSATATDLVDITATVTRVGPTSYPVGETEVIWKATDAAGNTGTATQRVEIVDTTAPVVTPPVAVTAEATGPLTSPPLGDASAQDLVDGIVSPVSGAPAGFGVGVTTVTWTATDVHGNSGTANQLVTIVDTTPPTLATPPAITLEATGPGTPVTLTAPTATDLVGVVAVQSAGPPSFAVGDTPVTWTATDAAGNAASVTQIVTIVDTTPPVVTAPRDLQVEATASQSIVDIGLGTAADLVDGRVQGVVSDAPTAFAVGTTLVTWRAMDTAGNTGTAVQTVIVVDTTPPVVNTPANVGPVEATALLSPVAISLATASDAVGVTGLSSDKPAAYPVGTTTVTWTAVDATGNVGTATQTVEVVDTTAPMVTAPAGRTLEATGPQTPVDPGQATATDAVGVVAIRSDAAATMPLDDTVVTWYAVDAAGNEGQATQRITIIDTTPPAITLPPDVVAYEATARQSPVAIGAANAIDLVDGSVAVTSDAPAVYPVGTTTVTWTSTDARGNTSMAKQSVEVVDTTAPTVTPPAVVVAWEATAPLSPVTIGQAMATDLVGVVGLANDAPSVYPVGTTTVTWTATDSAGNAGTATQTVEVVDTTAPVVTSPGDRVVEATGKETPYDQGTAMATDVVGVVSLVSDAPQSYRMGPTVVTWTATDLAGNVGQVAQTVQLVDTTAPVVTPPDSILGVEATGPLTLVDVGLGHAFDLVSLAVAVRHDGPATFPVGRTTVAWTAVDSVGNVGHALQTVQVIDTTPPVINLPLDTADLWPVNHKLQRVSGPITAIDLVDPAPVLAVAVASNQLINGPGDGSTVPDWQIDTDAAGDVTGVQLRAERDGSDKAGRTYTVTVTVTDQYDNTAIVSGEVFVPHSKGKGAARPVAVGEAVPTQYALYQNAPNPFNPETVIRFDVPEPATVELRIFDLLGQQVLRLVSEEAQAGAYTVHWNGRNAHGQPMATGVYICRLQAGSFVQVRKMTLLR